MKIKILKSFWSPVGSFQQDDETDLPEATAQNFIVAGLAERINPEAKPVAKTEKKKQRGG